MALGRRVPAKKGAIKRSSVLDTLRRAATVVTPVKKVAPPAPKVSYSYEGELGEEAYRVIARKGTDRWEFSARSENTPYCCGLYELGSFSDDDNNDRSTRITHAEKIAGLRGLLDYIIEETTESDRCYTTVFTLIDNEACNLLEEALEGSRHYTLAKTFINANSSNENKLYVSNN